MQRQSVWSILPCSLVDVPLSGQFANTSSATHVRLFLPCNRKVQSRSERSRAFWVSSFTPLQGGILVINESIWSVPHITERQKHNLHNDRKVIYIRAPVQKPLPGTFYKRRKQFTAIHSCLTHFHSFQHRWGLFTLTKWCLFSSLILLLEKDYNSSEWQSRTLAFYKIYLEKLRETKYL